MQNYWKRWSCNKEFSALSIDTELVAFLGWSLATPLLWHYSDRVPIVIAAEWEPGSHIPTAEPVWPHCHYSWRDLQKQRKTASLFLLLPNILYPTKKGNAVCRLLQFKSEWRQAKRELMPRDYQNAYNMMGTILTIFR